MSGLTKGSGFTPQSTLTHMPGGFTVDSEGLTNLGGVDPAFVTWLAAVVTAGGSMSAPQQTIRNATFASLRSSGWLVRLDRLALVSGNQTASLVDLITKQTYAVTGTMPFTTNQGFTSDGTTGFFDTGLTPTAATHYTLTSGLFGAFVSSSRAVGGVMCIIGTEASSLNQSSIYPWYTDNNSYCGVNAEWSVGTANALAVHGIYIANRPDSAHMNLYRNTTQVNSQATAASGLDTENWLVANTNAGGVPGTSISTDTICGWVIGQGASGDVDQAVLYNILFNDLHGMGAL